MKALDYVFIALVTSVGVFTVLERIYADEWFSWSNTVAINWQKHDWYWVSWIFSYLGMYGVIALYFLYALFFSHDKCMLIWDGFFFTLNIFINNNLKMLYHQPRPFMTNPEIHPNHPSLDYGMPSGHAWGSTAICFLLWDKLLNRRTLKFKKPSFMAHLDDSFLNQDLDDEEKILGEEKDQGLGERMISGEDVHNYKNKP